MLEATLTNAITNALHAAFLLAYFLGAMRVRFPRAVCGLFFLLFVVKIMGVYVHYAPETPGAARLWAIIALSTLVMNFIVLREAGVGKNLTLVVLGICAGAVAVFLLGVEDFSYIALPTALVFGVAAAHAPGGSKLRLGLAMVVVSNLFWFAARKVGELVAGGEVPIAFRYDNDLYHFVLIASTFIIYQGFLERQRSKS